MKYSLPMVLLIAVSAHAKDKAPPVKLPPQILAAHTVAVIGRVPAGGDADVQRLERVASDAFLRCGYAVTESLQSADLVMIVDADTVEAGEQGIAVGVTVATNHTFVNTASLQVIAGHQPAKGAPRLWLEQGYKKTPVQVIRRFCEEVKQSPH